MDADVVVINHHLYFSDQALKKDGFGEILPEAQVVIELGRFLVGEAGIYVCRVLERKRSRCGMMACWKGQATRAKMAARWGINRLVQLEMQRIRPIGERPKRRQVELDDFTRDLPNRLRTL